MPKSSKGIFQAFFEAFADERSKPLAVEKPAVEAPQLRTSAIGVPYKLIRCKRSSIGLVISTTGLEIRAPRWTPIYEIEAAIAERRLWIARALAKQRDKLSRLSELRDSGYLLFRGNKLRIELRTGLFDHVDLSEQQCIVTSRTGELNTALLDAALYRIAEVELPQQARKMALAAGLPLSDSSVSKARTLWGSCTADGRVRLNFRLIQLPPALCSHVVAHELAHLVEFNHSKRFWAIVTRLDPDCAKHRRAVNRFSVLLEL